jgi:hypothetical protein
MVFAAAIHAAIAAENDKWRNKRALRDAEAAVRPKRVHAAKSSASDRARVRAVGPPDEHSDTSGSPALEGWVRVFKAWHHLPRVCDLWTALGMLSPLMPQSFARLQAFVMARAGWPAERAATFVSDAFAALSPAAPDLDAFLIRLAAPELQDDTWRATAALVRRGVECCIAFFARQLYPWVRCGVCTTAEIVSAVPSPVAMLAIAIAWEEGLLHRRISRRDAVDDAIYQFQTMRRLLDIRFDFLMTITNTVPSMVITMASFM